MNTRIALTALFLAAPALASAADAPEPHGLRALIRAITVHNATPADIELAQHPICGCDESGTCFTTGFFERLTGDKSFGLKNHPVSLVDDDSGKVLATAKTDHDGYYEVSDLKLPAGYDSGHPWRIREVNPTQQTCDQRTYIATCGRTGIHVGALQPDHH